MAGTAGQALDQHVKSQVVARVRKARSTDEAVRLLLQGLMDVDVHPMEVPHEEIKTLVVEALQARAIEMAPPGGPGSVRPLPA